MHVYCHATFDDALFMAHAWSMLHGHWLGAYGKLTLAKGPGYPLFLVIGSVLGLPINLSQGLLAIVAVVAVSVSVARISSRHWMGWVLGLLLLLEPIFVPLRVIRDDIYGMQVLLFMGCLLAALYGVLEGRNRIGMAALAGLTFGWFWLTREEGIWMVPSLLILFSGVAWIVRKRRPAWLLLIWAFLGFSGAFGATQLAFRGINQHYYGSFAGVDFKEHWFKRALQDLQDVQVGAHVDHVPVSEAVRMRLYQVSPAFAELRDELDAKSSPLRGWINEGCQIYRICNDYAGGWFVWAFRDAVEGKGHYSSPMSASHYYERLAKEIEKACGAKELTCRHSWVPFMPPLSQRQWRTVPSELWQSIKVLVFAADQPKFLPSYSTEGGLISLQHADILLNRPLRMPKEELASLVVMDGWYYSHGNAWFNVQCASGGAAPITLEREDSPDIVHAMHDSRAGRQRFHMAISPQHCPLVWHDALGAHPLRVDEFLHGTKADQEAGSTLYVDRARTENNVPHLVSVRMAHSLHARLIRIYATILPILGVSGMLGILVIIIQIVRKRIPLHLMHVLALAAWVGVVMRLLVLVLVDISSFPALNHQYMTPAYPLLILASSVSLYAWVLMSVNSSIASDDKQPRFN